ncbi:hypothetical protein GCM10027566_16690 [Arachidicoccus ginsenosidivorans]|uniref:SMP-30/Gluconolactonase/LRE-like region domain-containing protein n=1 Tax=Arachidicoccus ginsenosidivorans TaxID=496057 RepID=A0A5B8VHT3_9BACT|nr:hypothetical protein [Arachidicoccus ginsenosidivorans]QEC70849.1 hypothetical protein FSB73_03305 [Arachidicoccus ginsenosidivorans]
MMKNLLLFLALAISVHLLRAQTSVTLYATGFNGAHGLCFDASGNLYVTNRDGNTVNKIDPSGTIIATYTGFNHPLGIAIDQSDVRDLHSGTYFIVSGSNIFNINIPL